MSIDARHILQCRTWREAWERVRHQIGDDFPEPWRQKVWSSTVQVQGLDGLEMLRPGGMDIWRPKLEKLRHQIEDMERPPKYWLYVSDEVSDRLRDVKPPDYLDLFDEVYHCCKGFWGG